MSEVSPDTYVIVPKSPGVVCLLYRSSNLPSVRPSIYFIAKPETVNLHFTWFDMF